VAWNFMLPGSRLCPDCNAESSLTERYCPECGRRFTVVAARLPGGVYFIPVSVGAPALLGALGRWLGFAQTTMLWLLGGVAVALWLGLVVFFGRQWRLWKDKGLPLGPRLGALAFGLMLGTFAAALAFCGGYGMFLGWR
jgi:hypothetical protein